MKKNFMIPMLAVFIFVGIVTGAVLTFYGQVDRSATATPALIFTGSNAPDITVSAGGNVSSEDLLVESDTIVNVPIDIVTTVSPNDAGIINTINYLLDNSAGTCANYPAPGWRDECEKRIDFDGMALSNFNSMSWDTNVIDGYVSHVDLILDNGESLTIEYATFDSDCNAPSSYPEGEYTFEITSNTYAWESIPGPCGDSAFENQHNTLTEWKATYPTANITRIEMEIDNWISASNSEVSNIVINGEDVSEEPFLLPSGSLNFNVLTVFPLNVADNYTITTEVQPRI